MNILMVLYKLCSLYKILVLRRKNTNRKCFCRSVAQTLFTYNISRLLNVLWRIFRVSKLCEKLFALEIKQLQYILIDKSYNRTIYCSNLLSYAVVFYAVVFSCHETNNTQMVMQEVKILVMNSIWGISVPGIR